MFRKYPLNQCQPQIVEGRDLLPVNLLIASKLSGHDISPIFGVENENWLWKRHGEMSFSNSLKAFGKYNKRKLPRIFGDFVPFNICRLPNLSLITFLNIHLLKSPSCPRSKAKMEYQ